METQTQVIPRNYKGDALPAIPGKEVLPGLILHKSGEHDFECFALPDGTWRVCRYWILTHRATGFRAFWARTRKELLALVPKIEHVSWTFQTEAGAPKEARKLVRLHKPRRA